MLEGYHHFVSLRKASYTLIDGQPRFRDTNVNKHYIKYIYLRIKFIGNSSKQFRNVEKNL